MVQSEIAPPHPLEATYPAFLARFDSEPNQARSEFCEFAYRLLTTRPPRVFGMVRRELRDDLIQDVLLHCLDRDCRVLRSYHDQGKPFAAWLLRVAANLARSRAVKYDAPPEQSGPEPAGLAPESDFLLTGAVERCLRSLGAKCQFLLRLLGDGLKPAEMAAPVGVFLCAPVYSNKQASDDLRHCKALLRQALVAAGVEVEALWAWATPKGGGEAR
jgi:DNA-directed RNA polymerase specialized sigma24 family protein